jgi:hypothetical protein
MVYLGDQAVYSEELEHWNEKIVEVARSQSLQKEV